MLDFLKSKYEEALSHAGESSQKKVKIRLTGLDPRVADYPLMDNPVWNTVSVLLYLYIVYYGGPAFMKDRKPFEFRKFLFVYNMALVVLSGWMFYEVSYRQLQGFNGLTVWRSWLVERILIPVRRIQ